MENDQFKIFIVNKIKTLNLIWPLYHKESIKIHLKKPFPSSTIPIMMVDQYNLTSNFKI